MISTSHILLVTLALAATTRAGWITGNALAPRQSPGPNAGCSCACPDALTSGEPLSWIEYNCGSVLLHCYYVQGGQEGRCSYALGYVSVNTILRLVI